MLLKDIVSCTRCYTSSSCASKGFSTSLFQYFHGCRPTKRTTGTFRQHTCTTS